MSRSIVRRLTAVLLLAAVLCVAAPAAAAPAGRVLSPVVSGPSLLDQFLAWLGSLWLGPEPQGHGAVEKGGTLVSGSGGLVTDESKTSPADHSGTIDPNG
jgi:hypothetical protein